MMTDKHSERPSLIIEKLPSSINKLVENDLCITTDEICEHYHNVHNKQLQGTNILNVNNEQLIFIKNHHELTARSVV